MVDGVEALHEEGASTRGAMSGCCELREKEPELFTDTAVMQQTAAVRDEVNIKWSQELLHMEAEERAVLLQHDLLGTQWTKATRSNAFNLSIGKTVIAA